MENFSWDVHTWPIVNTTRCLNECAGAKSATKLWLFTQKNFFFTECVSKHLNFIWHFIVLCFMRYKTVCNTCIWSHFIGLVIVGMLRNSLLSLALLVFLSSPGWFLAWWPLPLSCQCGWVIQPQQPWCCPLLMPFWKAFLGIWRL